MTGELRSESLLVWFHAISRCVIYEDGVDPHAPSSTFCVFLSVTSHNWTVIEEELSRTRISI